jgi:hypothetical protein
MEMQERLALKINFFARGLCMHANGQGELTLDVRHLSIIHDIY